MPERSSNYPGAEGVGNLRAKTARRSLDPPLKRADEKNSTREAHAV